MRWYVSYILGCAFRLVPKTAFQYQPRSSNAHKAQANWERRSQHLLTELVKYQTYVETLRSAMALRLKKRGEKALERALVVVPDDNDPIPGKRKAALEDPSTPGGRGQQHRREVAEIDLDDA